MTGIFDQAEARFNNKMNSNPLIQSKLGENLDTSLQDTWDMQSNQSALQTMGDSFNSIHNRLVTNELNKKEQFLKNLQNNQVTSETEGMLFGLRDSLNALGVDSNDIEFGANSIYRNGEQITQDIENGSPLLMREYKQKSNDLTSRLNGVVNKLSNGRFANIEQFKSVMDIDENNPEILKMKQLLGDEKFSALIGASNYSRNINRQLNKWGSSELDPFYQRQLIDEDLRNYAINEKDAYTRANSRIANQSDFNNSLNTIENQTIKYDVADDSRVNKQRAAREIMRGISNGNISVSQGTEFLKSLNTNSTTRSSETNNRSMLGYTPKSNSSGIIPETPLNTNESSNTTSESIPNNTNINMTTLPLESTRKDYNPESSLEDNLKTLPTSTQNKIKDVLEKANKETNPIVKKDLQTYAQVMLQTGIDTNSSYLEISKTDLNTLLDINSTNTNHIDKTITFYNALGRLQKEGAISIKEYKEISKDFNSDYKLDQKSLDLLNSKNYLKSLTEKDIKFLHDNNLAYITMNSYNNKQNSFRFNTDKNTTTEQKQDDIINILLDNNTKKSLGEKLSMLSDNELNALYLRIDKRLKDVNTKSNPKELEELTRLSSNINTKLNNNKPLLDTAKKYGRETLYKNNNKNVEDDFASSLFSLSVGAFHSIDSKTNKNNLTENPLEGYSGVLSTLSKNMNIIKERNILSNNKEFQNFYKQHLADNMEELYDSEGTFNLSNIVNINSQLGQDYITTVVGAKKVEALFLMNAYEIRAKNGSKNTPLTPSEFTQAMTKTINTLNYWASQSQTLNKGYISKEEFNKE